MVQPTAISLSLLVSVVVFSAQTAEKTIGSPAHTWMDRKVRVTTTRLGVLPSGLGVAEASAEPAAPCDAGPRRPSGVHPREEHVTGQRSADPSATRH